MRKHNYIADFCAHVKTLQKLYPTRTLGSHLDTLLADYPSLWNLTDKSLARALEDYITALEIDPIASEAEVDRIIREASNLDTILDDPEEEDDF